MNRDKLPVSALLTGIQCSTAHITNDDNSLLYHVSHQQEDYGNGEWCHFTGTGYLIRLNAWQHPVLRLKQLGLCPDATPSYCSPSFGCCGGCTVGI